ncbi:MAG: hypothetical protein V5A21_13230, partial [Halapricum sp.]
CTPATLTTDIIPGGVPGQPGNPRGGRAAQKGDRMPRRRQPSRRGIPKGIPGCAYGKNRERGM